MTNSYIPNLSGPPTYTATTSSISITFNVGSTNNYVVVGLINNYFNATSMAIPSNYMIKKGEFSMITNFNQVFMNYTSGSITINFSSLTANQNYSLFYFTTVDDAAINAQYSMVQYISTITASYLQVDLF